MNALIVGVPRSGTTLISNLMHNPREGRICLNEPLVSGCGQLKNRTSVLLASHGITADRIQDIATDWPWGIKEVWSERYNAAFMLGKPRKVIFVIRNLLDSMSSRQGAEREPDASPISKSDKDNAVSQFMAFVNLVQALDVEHHFISYEKFVNVPDYVEQVAEEIGWPLNGDPNFQLAYLKRSDEIRDGIKARIVDERNTARAVRVTGKNQDYQQRFGYL